MRAQSDIDEIKNLTTALRIASNMLMISRGLKAPPEGVDSSNERLDKAAIDLYNTANGDANYDSF